MIVSITKAASKKLGGFLGFIHSINLLSSELVNPPSIKLL